MAHSSPEQYPACTQPCFVRGWVRTPAFFKSIERATPHNEPTPESLPLDVQTYAGTRRPAPALTRIDGALPPTVSPVPVQEGCFRRWVPHRNDPVGGRRCERIPLLLTLLVLLLLLPLPLGSLFLLSSLLSKNIHSLQENELKPRLSRYRTLLHFRTPHHTYICRTCVRLVLGGNFDWNFRVTNTF